MEINYILFYNYWKTEVVNSPKSNLSGKRLKKNPEKLQKNYKRVLQFEKR